MQKVLFYILKIMMKFRCKFNKIIAITKLMEKKFLNLETKFQKRRRERQYLICKDYVSYASQITDNETTPWRVICGIADKYSISANTVLVALRQSGIYRSKTEPISVNSIANLKEIL